MKKYYKDFVIVLGIEESKKRMKN